MTNTVMYLSREKKKPIPVRKIITLALLIFYTIWLFFPILIMVITSFTSTDEINSSLSFVWFPKVTLEAYIALFSQDQYLMDVGIPGIVLGFLNTLWITIIPLVISLFMSAGSAYVFSKFKFRGRRTLFAISVITMSFPLGAFTVISYVFYSWLGWTDSVLPLLIPGFFGSCSTMFFLRMYFDSVPDGLIEAAKIDGAGFWGIFFKIMLPLAKPALIAQFIFGFVGGYNNFLGASLYLSNVKELVTLQLVLGNVKEFFHYNGQQNIWCAAGIVGMLPLIVLYIVMQKYFIEGVAMGGIKE